jgi:hypothetical protein
MTPRDPKPNEKKFLFGFFPNANLANSAEIPI